ncbi:two component response regulator [Bordetella ansorpii]|uniref:Two component response regulator n=1 Tax=Bordetella ansorpii TaxID=288768 RepID=A0A157P8F1_9BORD|nr:response regulator transcription factor [Bordetella ansorpii]SAI29748.1 two component response regulator [Bordetella ansorpii]
MYAAMPMPAHNKLVMLVDDAPDNLKMLSDALDQAGYMVVVATDGAQALARLDFVLPDIVLLDALMPGMDGFETCRRLKAHRRAAQVPVVFMTGLTEPEDVVRGFQAGGVDYVTKPIDPSVVLARLEAHLRTASVVSAALDAMDAAANAVVVLDAGGRITWKTAKARLWLAQYLDMDGEAQQLPAPLAQWVAARQADHDETQAHLTVRNGRELRIRLSASQRGGEPVLLLEEGAAAPEPAMPLGEAYRLTVREAEVLSWLAKGKTNRDISEILGMSPRTVNKHLEHIYVKLGVETRAAATALALTHLHRAS